MSRNDVSKWIERNSFLAMAATMMSIGLLVGVTKQFFQSEGLNRASLLCILASIAFVCMALLQNILKKNPRRKKCG